MVIIFARKVAQVALFALLCYIGARIVNPATFISLNTTRRLAIWLDGNVNQENFDDLWVLVWVVCSLIFASISYMAIIIAIKKMRR